MGVTEKADIFTIAQYGNYETFQKKYNVEDLNNKNNIGSSLLHYAIL